MQLRRRGGSRARVATTAATFVAFTAIALAACLGSTAGISSAAAAPRFTGMDFANDAVVQPDGKIVVVGASEGNFALARYTVTGLLDRGFGQSGGVVTDFGTPYDTATAVATQPDGKIVVAGVSDGNFAVARYTVGGELDRAFSGDGKQVTSFGGPDDGALAVLRQADGKIVAAGRGVDGFAVARYTAAGALDSRFGQGGRVSLAGSPVTDLVEQADGKIVAVGAYVTRLLHDGTVDSTFDTGGLGDGGEGWRRLDQQSDGRLVLAGASDCNVAMVGRVGTAGAFDIAFSQNAGLPIGVAAVGLHVLPGDRVLVVSDGRNDGACTALPGITLERYLADGRRDDSFGAAGAEVIDTSAWPDGAAGAPAVNFAMAPDGSIVVVGRTYLARFRSCGVLDQSFGRDGVVLTGL